MVKPADGGEPGGEVERARRFGIRDGRGYCGWSCWIEPVLQALRPVTNEGAVSNYTAFMNVI
jgi:hypothetical protein